MGRFRRRFQVVGHRGAAARAPENTAVSLEAGLAAEADAIEIDVGPTRDGRLVLLHDTSLDRTTSGRGALRSASWERVARLDAGSWFAPRFAGEPPIDLDDALAIVRPRAELIVEIKAAGDDRAVARAVLEAFERTGGLRGVTVSSASWETLASVRDASPGADLALTVRSTERRDPIEWARRLGASALHPSHRICSPELVGRAASTGLRVIPYTVNEAALLDRLVDAGADGVFTDDPARTRRLLERREKPAAERSTLTLGIDQGSGGTRAVLIDREGRIAAARAVRVASRKNGDGEIVQDPLAVAASVGRAVAPLVERHGPAIDAAGLAVQRSSLVVWLRRDATPVSPVLSWRAGTTYVPPAGLLRVEERLHAITGLTSRYPYGAIRLAALMREDPDLARGIADGRLVAGPLGAFLAARLAGGRAPCDPSLAQRTLAFDLAHGTFSTEIAAWTGVPAGAWPELAPSTASRGSLRFGRRRVPLTALLGDVGAAAHAALRDGATKGVGVLVLGTGGFVVVPTGRRPVEAPGLLTTLLLQDDGGPRYAIEGTVHGLAAGLVEAGRRGGWEALPAPRIAARLGAASRAPEVIAAVEGTGTPDWEVAPRFVVPDGSFTAEEIVRGTVEDLAGRFGRIAALLRAVKALPSRFVATGGLAFAPHLTARIAARMGVAVEVDPRTDLTAVGAALLARGRD